MPHGPRRLSPIVSTGLLALLDDVAALAKLAAASLDDTAALAVKAGGKATGIVIDDTAVTPRYVVGFTAERELPIIARIAKGSLKNKLLYLTPGALALSALAPWSLTPLLMAGGAFLCFEGAHKVFEARAKRRDGDTAHTAETLPESAVDEDARVASAVRTDMILSAEILAITLGDVADRPLAQRAAVLVAVGLAMTVLVYGLVAAIVKADDLGVLLARSRNGAVRALGRGLVRAMPALLRVLASLGTVAMLWVGGGIVSHGLHVLGLHAPDDALDALAGLAARSPVASAFAAWLVGALAAALFGLAVGALVDAIVTRVGAPLVRRLRARRSAARTDPSP